MAQRTQGERPADDNIDALVAWIQGDIEPPPTPHLQTTAAKNIDTMAAWVLGDEDPTPAPRPRTTADHRTREERALDRDIDEVTAAWILADEGHDPDDLQDVAVRDILRQVGRLIGYNKLTLPQKIILRRLVVDTIRQGSIAWGIRQAQTWGGVFDVPMTQLIADAAFIALHGSLPEAARARWDELADGCMTEEKVHATIDKTNSYFQRVFDLSRRGGGVPIHVPDDFVPNSLTESDPPKLSQQMQQAGAALRRMVYEGYHQKRLCFLMTTAEAMKYDPHINPSHWATKAGTPEGRNCLNGSNGGKGNQALNSDALRE